MNAPLHLPPQGFSMTEHFVIANTQQSLTRAVRNLPSRTGGLAMTKKTVRSFNLTARQRRININYLRGLKNNRYSAHNNSIPVKL